MSEETDQPVFERGPAEEAQITTEFEGGFSWIAHPEEDGKRASHAIRTDDGVWLIDPLDAPGIDERIAELGEVVGVAVLMCWHARDAEAFAKRYDVAVHVPEWMDRIEELVDAPVERYALAPPGFRGIPCRPFPLWQELCLYHEPGGTLIVPDSLGTTDAFLIGEERLAPELFRRLQPPEQLSGLEPERILVGHGKPITENAPEALAEALAGARLSFPAAARENGPEAVRSFLAAMLD